MKTEIYGAYLLEISEQVIRLHYKWGFPDFLYSSFLLIPGLVFLGIGLFTTWLSYTEWDASFIGVLIPILFFIGSSYYLLDYYRKISKPRSNILRIEKKSGIVQLRNTKGNHLLHIKELDCLTYKFVDQKFIITNYLRQFQSVGIYFKTKNGEMVDLTMVDHVGTKAYKPFDSEISEIQLAQSLSNRLAKLMSLKSLET